MLFLFSFNYFQLNFCTVCLFRAALCWLLLELDKVCCSIMIAIGFVNTKPHLF
jgi:hypothetical protein